MVRCLKYLFAKKFFRFLVAGGINTVFSFLCFSILMLLIGNKEIAVTIILLIAVFFNYNTSARFVFKDSKMHLGQILKFYVVYFITYPLNLLHLYLTVDLWGWNVYLSQFTTLLYMPIISFLLQRKFVFSEKGN